MARRGVPRRLTVALALALGVTLAVAGCSGGVGPGSESIGDGAPPVAESSGGTGARTTSPPATPSPDPSSGEATPTPTTRGGRDHPAGAAAFAYVPWGPDDPPVPQRYFALATLAAGPSACDDAASNAPPGAFWALALEVCRALAGTGPWPATTAVPAPPDASNAYETCLDAELGAMLRRALAAHAAAPAAAPRVQYAAPGTRSPCQTTVFEARVLTAADGYGSDVVPAGLVAVRVFAGSADVTSTVTVDGVPAEVLDVVPASGAATLVVLVPAPSQATTVPLAVTTTRGVLTTSLALPAAASDTPPDTPPETPAPTLEPTAPAVGGGTTDGTATPTTGSAP